MRKDYALSPVQRADAREALALLGDRKLSLKYCVEFTLSMHGVKAGASKTLIPVATDRFLQSVLARGKRPATFSFYEGKLGVFVAWAEAKSLDDIDRPTLKKWLEGIGGGPTYKRMVFRSVRAMYRWATRQDPPLTSSDPTVGLVLDLPAVKHSPKFFTVETCERLLRDVGEDLLPAVAVALFAGVRPEELYPVDPTKPRLGWESVKLAEKVLRVEAEVSKTGRGRVLEKLPAALWEWIRPHLKEAGPVCPYGYATAHARIRAASQLEEWIDDGPRHTFATYLLAHTNDSGRVSHWLGHEGRTTLIHTNYAGLTDKKTAARFLALRP